MLKGVWYEREFGLPKIPKQEIARRYPYGRKSSNPTPLTAHPRLSDQNSLGIGVGFRSNYEGDELLIPYKSVIAILSSKGSRVYSLITHKVSTSFYNIGSLLEQMPQLTVVRQGCALDLRYVVEARLSPRFRGMLTMVIQGERQGFTTSCALYPEIIKKLEQVKKEEGK